MLLSTEVVDGGLKIGGAFGAHSGLATASWGRIRRALIAGLERRTLHLQARQLCQIAQISPPTFYTQCANCNLAHKDYEWRLKQGFAASLSGGGTGRKALLAQLLRFLRRNGEYFRAACRRNVYWLMAQIFGQLRFASKTTRQAVVEVGEEKTGVMSEKIRLLYLDAVTLLLQEWVLEADESRLEDYLQRLLRIRKIDLGL